MAQRAEKAPKKVLVHMIPYASFRRGSVCALFASPDDTLGSLLERLRPLPGLGSGRLEVGCFRPGSLDPVPGTPFWSQRATVADYIAVVGLDPSRGPNATAMVFCTPPG